MCPWAASTSAAALIVEITVCLAASTAKSLAMLSRSRPGPPWIAMIVSARAHDAVIEPRRIRHRRVAGLRSDHAWNAAQ